MREIHKISIISIVIVGLFQEGGEAGKKLSFLKLWNDVYAPSTLLSRFLGCWEVTLPAAVFERAAWIPLKQRNGRSRFVAWNLSWTKSFEGVDMWQKNRFSLWLLKYHDQVDEHQVQAVNILRWEVSKMGARNKEAAPQQFFFFAMTTLILLSTYSCGDVSVCNPCRGSRILGQVSSYQQSHESEKVLRL